jgi:hypothetical protein
MINTSITPMSYKDAASLLNTNENTIASCVRRKTFVRLPTIGQEQQLVKEQVELFKNKKQIRITMLSSEELKLWQHYNDLVKNEQLTTDISTLTDMGITEEEIDAAMPLLSKFFFHFFNKVKLYNNNTKNYGIS